MERTYPENKVEVLIVGAGPTGLMMACQLALYKVPFRIIDKNGSLSDNSGALIVQARTLEIFEKMGIAGKALEEGIIADKINVMYNGKIVAGTDIRNIGSGVSRFPFLLMLEQSKTERLLVNFIEEHGFPVERRTTFTRFTESGEGITSVVTLPDGTEQSILSTYLIAADGVNSTLRELLKIPFEGKTYPRPLFILDCKAETELNQGEIYFTLSNSSIAGFFPLKDSRWRIDSNFPGEIGKSETINIKDIGENFHVWTKVKVIFKTYEWFSVSHSQQRYAGRIRAGNCFLTGDAAHVNTPIGAQGMNTGMQDAFNLAWKLALVIKQKAKPELLDTYSAERSGISKGFARYADLVFMLVTGKNIVLDLCRPPLMKLILNYMIPWVAKRKKFREMFFKSISQTGLRYKAGSLSACVSKGDFSRNSPGPGERFPSVTYPENGKEVNIQDNLKGACFHLFILHPHSSAERMIRVAERYLDILSIESIPFTTDTKAVYDRLGIRNLGCYLVRPDMYIAWRSDSVDPRQLENYLQQILI